MRGEPLALASRPMSVAASDVVPSGSVTMMSLLSSVVKSTPVVASLYVTVKSRNAAPPVGVCPP